MTRKPVAAPNAPRCEACNAYAPVNATQGTCRDAPPVLHVTGEIEVDGQKRPMTTSFWPLTAADGWCRQFAPARPARR